MEKAVITQRVAFQITDTELRLAQVEHVSVGVLIGLDCDCKVRVRRGLVTTWLALAVGHGMGAYGELRKW